MTGNRMQSEAFDWHTLIRSPLTFVTLAKKKYSHYKEAQKEIDNAVDIIDPSIKSIRGYRKRLRPPLHLCRDHCRKIVSQIPGPIMLDTANYTSNSLIKAAFPDNKAFATILQQADAEQMDPGVQEQIRVALLTMTHSERNFLGTARDGQMIVGDARLKAVTFSDHKVVGIATSLEESRQRLEKVIFDVIIESASNEVADRRSDLNALQEQGEKLKAMWKMFGESSTLSTGEVEHERERKFDKVKHYLKENESSLSEAKSDAETPAARLDFLVEFLSRPELVMDIQLTSLRLDWSNVLTKDPEIAANTITFAQCAIHEAKKRDAVLISYILNKNTNR